MRKQKRTRAYRFSGGSPAFPARWFYGLLRALPGDRAFLPPSLADVAANLMPASGHQDHATSPSASALFVSQRFRVHRIPPRVDDVGQRPSVGRTRGSVPLICPTGPAEYFFNRDWTGQIALIRLDKSAFCSRATAAPPTPAIGPRRSNLIRQRIGTQLDVHGARPGALAAFLEPGRGVAG